MKEQEKRYTIGFVFLSTLGGIAAAYTLATNVYQSNLKTNLDWVAMLALLTFGFGVAFFILLPPLWNRFLSSSTRTRFWFSILVLFSAVCLTFSFKSYLGAAFIFQLFLCSILASPGLFWFDKLLEK